MLDHMILTVSNVERSLAFYEAALSAACSKSTFQFLTTGLRGDVKESRKYAGMNWLRHKVQYHGNSSVRYAPYLTWVLTANS